MSTHRVHVVPVLPGGGEPPEPELLPGRHHQLPAAAAAAAVVGHRAGGARHRVAADRPVVPAGERSHHHAGPLGGRGRGQVKTVRIYVSAQQQNS